MRETGRISGWKDERGFGFVAPHAGGPHSFLHYKAFARGSRRPVDGDLISYRTVTDERGRSRAVDARYAGERRPPRSSRRMTLPRYGIAGGFLLLVVAAAVLGLLPQVVAAAYLLGSLVSFVLYAFDKSAAGTRRQRTPENTLHAIDVLGGWPGALAAQQKFRHKTVKSSFQVMFWITVVLNLAGVWWLVRSGMADALMASIGR